ncbi:hypothetical protein EHI8A_050660 [Entamoeba histolytica HM-1:IMSS-B]|uniref:Uncharacterized protein n=6 Tax=Entamoeba histolytica TaxID=5759 RepID=A0A175JUS8_ENTHI|nr:hypothetical protein EHI8A_050660 [Entamoeba histolytica HM-1:IMSS-B]EMS15129.1 hypothetical protein KM1_097570 [Entamoeba histolytica HM-3:IMSS]ENY62905.1 hypothetical protein EHI7A_050780 [Entamoeba histolytica HM-1:IMSS-A]GAT97491.1 hypothetical protein CL6EHI_112070 [Entamoeba histolytica]
MQHTLQPTKEEDVFNEFKDNIVLQLNVLNTIGTIMKKTDKKVLNKIIPMVGQLIELTKKEKEITQVGLNTSGSLLVLEEIYQTMNEEKSREYVSYIQEVMTIKMPITGMGLYYMSEIIKLYDNIIFVNEEIELLLLEFKHMKEVINKTIETFTVLSTLQENNERSKIIVQEFISLNEEIKKEEIELENKPNMIIDKIRSIIMKHFIYVVSYSKLQKIFLVTSQFFAIRLDNIIQRIQKNKSNLTLIDINDFIFLIQYYINCISLISFYYFTSQWNISSFCNKLFPLLQQIMKLMTDLLNKSHTTQEIFIFLEKYKNELLFISFSIKSIIKDIVELIPSVSFETFKHTVSDFFMIVEEIDQLNIDTSIYDIIERMKKVSLMQKKFQSIISMVVQYDTKDVHFENSINIISQMVNMMGSRNTTKVMVHNQIKNIKQSITEIMIESSLFIPIFSFGIETQKFAYQNNIVCIFSECQQCMKYLSSFIRNSKDGGVYHNYEPMQMISYLKNSYFQKKFCIFPSVSKEITTFFDLLETRKFKTIHEMVQFVYESQMEISNSFTPQTDMIHYCINEIKNIISLFLNESLIEKLEEIISKSIIISKMCQCFILQNQTNEITKYPLSIEKQIKSIKIFSKSGNISLKIIKEPIHELQKILNSLQQSLYSTPFESFGLVSSQCHSSGSSSFFQSLHSICSQKLFSTDSTISSVDSCCTITLDYRFNEIFVLLRESFNIITCFRGNGKKKITKEEFVKFKEKIVNCTEHCFIFFFDLADTQYKQITTNAIEVFKQYIYFISIPTFPKYYNIISEHMAPTCLSFFSSILRSFYSILSQKLLSVRSEIESLVHHMEPSQVILFTFQKKYKPLIHVIEGYLDYFVLYEPKKNIYPITKFIKWAYKLPTMSFPIDFKPLFMFDIESIKPTKEVDSNLLLEKFLTKNTVDVLLNLYGFDNTFRLCLQEDQEITDIISIISCYQTFITKSSIQFEFITNELKLNSTLIINELTEIQQYANLPIFVHKIMYGVTKILKYIFPIKRVIFILRKELKTLINSFSKDEEIEENGLKNYLIIIRYYCLLLKYNYINENCNIINKSHYLNINEFISNIFEIIHFLFCQRTFDTSWIMLLKFHISFLFSIQFEKLENLIYPVIFFIIKNQNLDELQQQVINKVIISIKQLLGIELKKYEPINLEVLLKFSQTIVEHYSSIEKFTVVKTFNKLNKKPNKEELDSLIILFYKIICDEMYLNINNELYYSLNKLRKKIVKFYNNLFEEINYTMSLTTLITDYITLAPMQVKFLWLCLCNIPSSSSLLEIIPLINTISLISNKFQSSIVALYLPTLEKMIKNKESDDKIKQIIYIIISILYQPLGNIVKKSIEFEYHLNCLKILNGSEKIISLIRKEKRGIEKNIFEINCYLQLAYTINNTIMKKELINKFRKIQNEVLTNHILFDQSIIQKLNEMKEISFTFVSSDFFIIFDILHICKSSLMTNKQSSLKQIYRLKLMWCEIEPFTCFFEGNQIPSMTNTIFCNITIENSINNLIKQVMDNNIEQITSFKYIYGVIQYLFRINDFATRHLKIIFDYYSNHDIIDISEKDFNLISCYFSMKQTEKMFVDETEDYEISLCHFISSLIIPTSLLELKSINHKYNQFNDIYKFSSINIIIDSYRFMNVFKMSHLTIKDQFNKIIHFSYALHRLEETIILFKKQTQEVLLLNMILSVIDTLYYRINQKMEIICQCNEFIDLLEEEKVINMILTLICNYTRIVEHFIVLKNICEDHLILPLQLDISSIINIPTLLFSLGQLIIGGVSRGVMYKCVCVISMGLKNEKLWEYARTLGYESAKTEFTDKLIPDDEELHIFEKVIHSLIQSFHTHQIINKTCCSFEHDNIIGLIRFALLQLFYQFKTNKMTFFYACLNQICVCLIGLIAIVIEQDQSLNTLMTEVMNYHDYSISLLNEEIEIDVIALFKQIHFILDKVYCIYSPSNSFISDELVSSLIVEKSLFILYTHLKEIIHSLLLSNHSIQTMSYSNYISFICSYNKKISILIPNFINSFFISYYLNNEEIIIHLKHPIISLMQVLSSFSKTTLCPFLQESTITISSLLYQNMISLHFYLDACFIFSLLNNASNDSSPIIRRMVCIFDKLLEALNKSTLFEDFPINEIILIINTIVSITSTMSSSLIEIHQRIKTILSILLNFIENHYLNVHSNIQNQTEINIHLSIAQYGLQQFTSHCTCLLISHLSDDSTTLLICAYLQIIVSEIISIISLLNH